MKLMEKIGRYIENYGKVPKRGSGLTSTETKTLVDMGIIELHTEPSKSGKLPRNPNYFSITPKGREIIRVALDRQVSTAEAVGELRKTLSQLNSQLELIQHKIRKVEETVFHAERLILSLEREERRRQREMSSEELLRLLKQAEEKAAEEQKSGPFVSTDVYFRALREAGIPEEEISKRLFDLFQEDLLELQLGPATKKGVRGHSGKVFHWGLVKS